MPNFVFETCIVGVSEMYCVIWRPILDSLLDIHRRRFAGRPIREQCDAASGRKKIPEGSGVVRMYKNVLTLGFFLQPCK